MSLSININFKTNLDKQIARLENRAIRQIKQIQVGLFNTAGRHYSSAPAYSFASEQSFTAGVGSISPGRYKRTAKQLTSGTWAGTFKSQLSAAIQTIRTSSKLHLQIWLTINSQAASVGVWIGRQPNTRYTKSRLSSLISAIEQAGWVKT